MGWDRFLLWRQKILRNQYQCKLPVRASNCTKAFLYRIWRYIVTSSWRHNFVIARSSLDFMKNRDNLSITLFISSWMLLLAVTSSTDPVQMISLTIPRLKCGLIGSNGIPTVTSVGIQTVLHQHLFQHQNLHQNQFQQHKHQISVQRNFEYVTLQIGLNIEQEMQRLVLIFLINLT